MLVSADGTSVMPGLRGYQNPQDHPIFILTKLIDDSASYDMIVEQPRRRIQSSASVMSDFVAECASFLLSPYSIEDEIVSQNEYTSFLVSRCRSDGLCDDDEQLEFEQLSTALQLTFVRGLCPYDDTEKRIICINELEQMWSNGGEFGYRVSQDGFEMLNEFVDDMCMDAYGDASETGLIRTFAPTSSPSAVDTNEPSIGTTHEPSVQPMVSSFPPSGSQSPTFVDSGVELTQLPLAPSPTYMPLSIIMNTITKSPIPSIADSHSLQPNLFDQPESFVHECKHVLLSPSFLEDGILSQIEFASFLTYRCHAEGLCKDDSKMTFEELDVGLQLDFIRGACSYDTEDCIDELEHNWRNGSHFGFDAGEEGIEVSISDLCSSAFAYALSMGFAATSAPTSANPTNLPTAMSLASPPSLVTDTPSRMPSIRNSSSNETIDSSSSADVKSFRPRRVLVGISAVLAVLLMGVGGVSAYRQSDLIGNKGIRSDYQSKDACHYGTSAHELWGRSPPFPFSISLSCGSSSSSFRDCRFVPVFGPDGQSIVQFDPNTAGAVVIGSVTIGGSSSISTGPFVKNDQSPSKDRIKIGQVSLSGEGVQSDSGNASEFSSLSSCRSTKAMQSNRLRKNVTGSRSYSVGLVSYDLDSESLSKSVMSRCTIPMTQYKSTKFERHVVRFDKQVSFADWKAASRMISENRNPTQITDSHAAERQRQFFFDLYNSPASENSDLTTNRASFHSLGISPRVTESGTDSNGEHHSSNTMSTESGSLTSNGGRGNEPSPKKHIHDMLIPWRAGGFSSSFQPSDGKQSERSACSSHSLYMEHRGNSIVCASNTSSPFHQVNTAFKRIKSIVKGWLKHKQYQNLNGQLQEDPSVISMQSYSSNIHLLPTRDSTRFGLPGLILGTWAAATFPVQSTEIPCTRSLHHDVDSGLRIPIDHATSDEPQTDATGSQDDNSSVTSYYAKSAILSVDEKDVKVPVISDHAIAPAATLIK